MSPKLFLFCLLIGFPASGVGAHEAHQHPSATEEINAAVPTAAIQAYRETIEPIFRKKCFDCHSTKTRYPWYYKLLGAKQLIDYDIREAREHIDMTDGFPFKGHHSVKDQLKTLEKVVRKNQMPLWRYRLLHPGGGLIAEEREKILDWVKSRRANLAL